MAKYDAAFYDVDVYAATIGASDIVFGDGTLTAAALDESTVRLDWRVPTSSFLELRIVRSTLGIPPDPVSGQAVTLIDVDFTNLNDPNINTTTLTDHVSSGSEVFYGMFVLAADPAQPLVRRWISVAAAAVQLVTDHHSYDRFRSALPASFVSTFGAEISGNDDEDEPLSQVLRAMGSSWDRILTSADRLLTVWDARKTPTRLVPSLSATLGLPIEPALGPKPQRALAANGSRLWSLKGTFDGVRILSECTTGTDILVAAGKNKLPSTEISAYEGMPVLTTALASPISSNADTTMRVVSTSQWPILRKQTSLSEPFWVVITSSNGVEVVKVTGASGTLLTIERSQFGTLAPASHEAGAPVVFQLVQPLWAVQPGYITTVVTQTEAGFTMPTAASTSADQPPLQDHALAITKVVASTSYPYPELSYGSTRYVTNYRRINDLGFVTTYTPHQLQVGQQIRGMFGNASAVTDTEATYQIINVVDRFTFAIQHHEGTLPDATMSQSQLADATPPYIIGLPAASTLVSVTPGVTYTYSAYIRAASTTRTVRPTISWWNAVGVQIGSTTLGTGVADDSSVWNRATVTAVAPAGAVLASVSMKWNAVNWAKGETHYVTQHQMEASTSETSYDDGGLVRVGLSTRADIDPLKVVRKRTRQLLSDHCGDSHEYRVEFMVRRALLPTGSTSARLQIEPGKELALEDLDVRIRFNADNLDDWKVLLTADDADDTAMLELLIGPISLRMLTKTGPPSAGDGVPFGGGTFGGGPFGGEGASAASTSLPHNLQPGQTYWVRFTRKSATGEIAFYTAPDSDSEPYNWTLLNLTVAPSGPFSQPIHHFEIGSDSGEGMIGRLYAVNFGTAIGDLVKFDPWLYDADRNAVPNSGLPDITGLDWILSSQTPDIMSIGTSLP